MRKLLVAAAPLYSLAIIYLSLVRLNLPSVELAHTDKLYHGAAYFLMALLWYWWYNQKAQVPSIFSLKRFKSSAIKTFVTCSVIGIFIEIAQGYLTSYRSMDVMDFVANTCGILIALILIRSTSQLFYIDKT